MKVLVLHTVVPAGLTAGRVQEEFDLSAAAAGIAEALPDCEVAGVPGEASEVVDVLRAEKPDVVWNLCEAPLGRPDREAHLASLLEWLGVPFTGCGSDFAGWSGQRSLKPSPRPLRWTKNFAASWRP